MRMAGTKNVRGIIGPITDCEPRKSDKDNCKRRDCVEPNTRCPKVLRADEAVFSIKPVEVPEISAAEAAADKPARKAPARAKAEAN